MTTTKIIQEIINTGLTICLLYMAYFETGPYTTIILVLISINLKLQSYLNTKNSENMMGISDLLGKIVNSKC